MSPVPCVHRRAEGARRHDHTHFGPFWCCALRLTICLRAHGSYVVHHQQLPPVLLGTGKVPGRHAFHDGGQDGTAPHWLKSLSAPQFCLCDTTALNEVQNNSFKTCLSLPLADAVYWGAEESTTVWFTKMFLLPAECGVSLPTAVQQCTGGSPVCARVALQARLPELDRGSPDLACGVGTHCTSSSARADTTPCNGLHQRVQEPRPRQGAGQGV